MISWIQFNEENSIKLFGTKVIITSRVIGVPTIKTNIIDIPFSSNIIDYSFINGVNFNYRPIEISFNLEGINREELYSIYSQMIMWLVKPNYSKLVLSDMEEYYFMAKVESITSLEEVKILGNMTVQFYCLPWKFEEEINIDKNYSNGNIIELFNLYMPSTPEIIASKICSIKYKNKTYSLKKGINKIFDITLKEGLNAIEVVSDSEVNLKIKYLRGVL